MQEESTVLTTPSASKTETKNLWGSLQGRLHRTSPARASLCLNLHSRSMDMSMVRTHLPTGTGTRITNSHLLCSAAAQPLFLIPNPRVFYKPWRRQDLKTSSKKAGWVKDPALQLCIEKCPVNWSGWASAHVSLVWRKGAQICFSTRAPTFSPSVDCRQEHIWSMDWM